MSSLILSYPFHRLHKTQDLLYDSTKDFLQLRYEGRGNERQWMGEKDKLLRELDTCRQQLNISPDKVLDVSDRGLESQMRKSEEVQVTTHDSVNHFFSGCLVTFKTLSLM